MKDASGNIRQWLYNILHGAISYNGSWIPVYSFATANKAKPYILLGENYFMGEELSTKDKWITEHQAIIEVYADDAGNRKGYAQLDSIVEDILTQIRGSVKQPEVSSFTGSGGQAVAGISGFNTVICTILSMSSQRYETDKGVELMKSIIIKLILEEV
jgi:hypothetical protein